jgi:hypothetical protein
VDIVDRPAWWGDPPEPIRARSIVELVGEGVIDAELAALLWVLVEGGLPLDVAGGRGSGRTTLLGALLAFVDPAAYLLAFEAATPEAITEVDAAPAGTRVLVPELLRGAGGIAHRGAFARAAVRALARGVGLATTIAGSRLEDVMNRLRGPSAGVPDDALSFLGIVVVLGPGPGAGEPPVVVAAHVVRPVARDEQGHVQRLGPAVLATRDAAGHGWDHFGWGIYPELASRLGLRAGDLEREHLRRRDLLERLVSEGVVDPDAVRRAIALDRAPDEAKPH